MPGGDPGPQDDPRAWLGSTPLLDLEDPRLRVRVHQLTQLARSEREAALAIYGFVKRQPFATPFKVRLHTARQVLDAGRGDATDKATLFLALLRLAGLPARVRYLTLAPDVMRGLGTGPAQPTRPVAEVFMAGAWVHTDSFIFDAEYAAAARERLRADGWSCGYGLHVDGEALWDGRRSGLSFSPPGGPPALVRVDHGRFADALAFVTSASYRRHHARLPRAIQWNVLAAATERAIRDLRADYRFA